MKNNNDALTFSEMELKPVNYDVAVRLNELGFDWNCHAKYCTKSSGAGLIKKKELYYSSFENLPDWLIYAPSQTLVLKWFREKYAIHVEIFCNHSGWGWILTKTNGTTIKEIEDSTFFETYELAEGEGIMEVLKYINK